VNIQLGQNSVPFRPRDRRRAGSGCTGTVGTGGKCHLQKRESDIVGRGRAAVDASTIRRETAECININGGTEEVPALATAARLVRQARRTLPEKT
jgi:hypothetical protein